jgi:hypoxanthine phosphoribosyltransferase
MPDLYIDWEQYHQCIEQLAIKIHRSFWQFDQIVCLAKGGLRIGDTLSRIYQKPLAILFAASYGGSDNRTRQQLKFSQHLAMLEDNLGKHILLVDDLADSGITLSSSVNWLKERSNIQEIRTAVLWYKSCSLVIPDYYVDYLPDNPWIHQPFEHYEKFSILLDK